MSNACIDFRATSRVSRRCLVRAGTAGLAGLALPTLLSAAAEPGGKARAKHILFLHQFGGPSHLDTFDMKPDAPDGIRGEFTPIATNQPGLRVSASTCLGSRRSSTSSPRSGRCITGCGTTIRRRITV